MMCSVPTKFRPTEKASHNHWMPDEVLTKVFALITQNIIRLSTIWGITVSLILIEYLLAEWSTPILRVYVFSSPVAMQQHDTARGGWWQGNNVTNVTRGLNCGDQASARTTHYTGNRECFHEHQVEPATVGGRFLYLKLRSSIDSAKSCVSSAQ